MVTLLPRASLQQADTSWHSSSWSSSDWHAKKPYNRQVETSWHGSTWSASDWKDKTPSNGWSQGGGASWSGGWHLKPNSSHGKASWSSGTDANDASRWSKRDSDSGKSWHKKRTFNDTHEATGEPEAPEEDARPHFHPSFLPPASLCSAEESDDVRKHRQELEIRVTGESAGLAVAPICQYQEIDEVLPSYTRDALAEMGISAPMPIQSQTLPFVLRGFDIIGLAKTGSGKTLAFLLPAIVHIESRPAAQDGVTGSPLAFVLAPVRELAVQIAEEANKILKDSYSDYYPRGIGAVAIYGGGERIRWQQVRELQKPWCQIVVATPGRAVDFLDSGDLVLSRVVYFVLDEADRMLDEGFGGEMETISAATSADRQTLFFSATWPLAVRQLARSMCKAPPIRVSVGQGEDGVDNGPVTRSDIVQDIMVFDGGDWQDHEKQKQAKLYSHVRALLRKPEYKVLVFVNTKTLAWDLAGKLGGEGFSCDFIYGGRSQDARQEVLRKFKVGEVKLLVTTDVMARGLDIPGISHVVIYDCYGGIDEYVHRIGRTARGPYGEGHALTFFEYDGKFPQMAAELIALLEQAEQVVPRELRNIAQEVEDGIRPVKKQKKW
eukprot:TRINITY_DN18740_c0_g1_i2.p1 TRINITY_DN18740_c0_g1~~TRINITY_DN18740_c0_g1_i2.p1  ORF type:complete len:607 (-),score=83.12 TRINITY_DN18740_c0_g1_i2:100-1920(-)